MCSETMSSSSDFEFKFSPRRLSKIPSSSFKTRGLVSSEINSLITILDKPLFAFNQTLASASN